MNTIQNLLPTLFLALKEPNWWTDPIAVLNGFEELVGLTLDTDHPPKDWQSFATELRPDDPTRNTYAWIHKTSKVWPGCVFIGDVVIDRSCEIGPNAVLFGPTYIGPNSYIGPNAEVRRTFVNRSLTLSHTSYLGHSVVGKNVNLAAGFITAVRNLKRATVHVKLNGSLLDTGFEHFGAIIADNFFCHVNFVAAPGRTLSYPVVGEVS